MANQKIKDVRHCQQILQVSYGNMPSDPQVNCLCFAPSNFSAAPVTTFSWLPARKWQKTFDPKLKCSLPYIYGSANYTKVYRNCIALFSDRVFVLQVEVSLFLLQSICRLCRCKKITNSHCEQYSDLRGHCGVVFSRTAAKRPSENRSDNA